MDAILTGKQAVHKRYHQEMLGTTDIEGDFVPKDSEDWKKKKKTFEFNFKSTIRRLHILHKNKK